MTVRAERSRGGLVIAMAGAILAQSVVIGFLVARPVPSVPSSILIESAQPGDAVMVKGSLGSRMAPIVAAIKARFGPSE